MVQKGVVLLLLLSVWLLVCHVVIGGTPQCECGNYKDIEIIDDDKLSETIAQVRKEFMSTVAISKFDRLDVTVLLPNRGDKKSWSRGSFNPRQLSYPASCVKLAYLIGSMHWCVDVKNTRLDCVEDHAHPMITYSDNLETGFVVDTISEQTNIYDMTNASDPRFLPWLAKRNFTQNYFRELNLIGNQIFIGKTYPTNSGEWPLGSEAVQRSYTGSNAMAPCCAASLILHTMYRLPKEQTEYAKRLLFHRHFDDWSAIAPALPPGSKYFSYLIH